MIQRTIALFTTILLASSTLTAQENLTVMFYNMLKFPTTTPDRADTLANIIAYTQPDIFIVSELQSAFGASLLLNNGLNANGITHYSKAVFQDANGMDTDNLLFYNNQKIGLIEQNNINTNLRAISEYIVYYKDPNLAITHDTTYIYLYGCHLKAGGNADNNSTEAGMRASEVMSLKNYLTNHNRTRNIIVGGDMNMYKSTEDAYVNMTTGGTINLFDPIGQAGNWHNSYSYRNVHTQSTRAVGATTYGGGSTGGLDDRFDMIFVSNDVMNGSQGVKYVTNSYKAVGQDGNHFNASVNSGTNSSVPQDVAQSLFYMSDHLPVLLKVSVGGPVSVQEIENTIETFTFNSESKMLNIYLSELHKDIDLTIYNTAGQIVYNKQYQQTNAITDYLSNLTSGMYIVTLVADGIPVSAKILVY